jgi:hypothetical protein
MTPDKAFEQLKESLPTRPVLLLGPGAVLLARRLWSVHEGDRSGGQIVTELSVDAARGVRTQAHIMGRREFRLFYLLLDEATVQAQDVLLKLLEEPPATARFILAAITRVPLPTVADRCLVYQLAAVGEPEEDLPDLSGVRAVVADALRAARGRQLTVLEAVMRAWVPEHTAQLRIWAAEAAAQCWTEFDGQFAPEVTGGQALKILAVLRAYEGARTAARVALDRAFSS